MGHKLVGTAGGLSSPQIFLTSFKALPCADGQVYQLPSISTFFWFEKCTGGLTQD